MRKIEVASEIRYALATPINGLPMFLTLDPIKKNNFYLTDDIRKASKTLNKVSAEVLYQQYREHNPEDLTVYEIVPFDLTYSFLDDEE